MRGESAQRTTAFEALQQMWIRGRRVDNNSSEMNYNRDNNIHRTHFNTFNNNDNNNNNNNSHNNNKNNNNNNNIVVTIAMLWTHNTPRNASLDRFTACQRATLALYAARHGHRVCFFDVSGPPLDPARSGAWSKVIMMRMLLSTSPFLMVMDADAFVADLDFDVRVLVQHYMNGGEGDGGDDFDEGDEYSETESNNNNNNNNNNSNNNNNNNNTNNNNNNNKNSAGQRQAKDALFTTDFFEFNGMRRSDLQALRSPSSADLEHEQHQHQQRQRTTRFRSNSNGVDDDDYSKISNTKESSIVTKNDAQKTLASTVMINTGVSLFRRSEWTSKFLASIYSDFPESIDHPFWEQQATRLYQLRRPNDFFDHARVVPCFVMNSAANRITVPKRNNPCAYRSGDFIWHRAGGGADPNKHFVLLEANPVCAVLWFMMMMHDDAWWWWWWWCMMMMMHDDDDDNNNNNNFDDFYNSWNFWLMCDQGQCTRKIKMF